MKKRHRNYHNPRTTRINEKLQKGRCDNCRKVGEVLYFCEKDRFYDRKLVEVTLCEECLSQLIVDLKEDKENTRSKVFLPILKFMKGDPKN